MVFGRAYPIKSAVHILKALKASTVPNVLSATQGSYALTGQATTLAVSVPAVQGSYALTGNAITLGVGETASQGSYSLSGQTQTLTRGVKSSAIQGTYSLSGQAQTLNVGLTAAQGSYGLTGQATTLTKVGGNTYTLAISTGVYHFTGLTISLFGPLMAGGGTMWQQAKYHDSKPKPIRTEYPKSQVHYGYHSQQPDVKRAAAHMSKLGGEARAASLSAKQRSNIASTAAKARWK